MNTPSADIVFLIWLAIFYLFFTISKALRLKFP